MTRQRDPSRDFIPITYFNSLTWFQCSNLRDFEYINLFTNLWAYKFTNLQIYTRLKLYSQALLYVAQDKLQLRLSLEMLLFGSLHSDRADSQGRDSKI